MIRDPSDGSVKEISQDASAIKDVHEETRADEITSGLRDPTDKSEITRLQRSRQWLANYRTNPEKTVREHGETGE